MDEYTYQNMAYYAAQYPYQQYQQYHRRPQQPSDQTVNSPLPPWRVNRQPMSDNGRPGSFSTRQVDSWRSYSTDTTNLQTTTTNTANLNAAAPVFQPSQSQKSTFKPYESLRVSNGIAERNLVETNNATQAQTQSRKKHRHEPKNTSAPLATVQPTAEFASRYPVRSRRGIADTPLPSIEPGEAVSNAANLPIRIVHARQSHPKPSPAPSATLDYISAAKKEPVRLAEARKLLIVLDLNGTLLYRNRSHGSSHLRPGVAPFIDYIFENHKVMIYTSATPEKAEIMVNSFLHPSRRKQLAAFWARDKLELTAFEYRNKVQVYKKLDKIWNDSAIQKSAEPGASWDQSNTILIDDSCLKALSQPFNLVQVPEYKLDDDPRRAGTTGSKEYKAAYETQLDVMKKLEHKIEELKFQEDVSRLIRQWRLKESEVQQPDQTPSQAIVSQEKGKPTANTHLPTPESLVDETEGGVRLPSPEATRGSSRERSGSVSSIGESVFQDLLQGNDK